MNDRWKKRLLASAIVALVIPGCGLPFLTPTETVRFKVTVEIDTPDGLKSGSSVASVTISLVGGVGGKPYRRVLNGQSVAIRLGSCGEVFTDRQPWLNYPDRELGRLLPMELRGGSSGDRMDYLHAIATLPAGAAVESHSRIRFFRFANLLDFSEMRSFLSDELATVCGPGYALRRTIISRTDEASNTPVFAVAPALESWLSIGESTAVARARTRLVTDISIRAFRPAPPDPLWP